MNPDEGTILSTPAAPPADTPLEKAGDEIGPYKLLSHLGTGGFGTVWLAERRQPFVQRVALKLVKPGMDSRSVLARFEQERQSLALMSHPNIAKVLDGGLTPAGRPYFAMEYVKAEPITDYCDQRRLGIRERLALFEKVCEAVQHAHLKGVIHRDLKPSNVLAFDSEGEAASVKVIDFGVAKAMSNGLAGHTIFTETGQMIGTPEYMSPEQADPSGIGIDTRSDVYSLGVLLYELLSGALPFEGDELRSKAYREMQRIIQEVDPPAPSARLATIATRDSERTGRIERTRDTRMPELVKDLRRELEWIPLMAMRKEPQKRYQSAVDLGRDVRNYLDGRPLVAAPESTAYRLRKYVRRHRGPVGAAACVAVALVAGLGVSLWQRNEAVTARDASQQREAEATAVRDFVTKSLVSADPMQGGAKDFTVRQAMKQAIARLGGGALKDQPQVEARLQLTIASILLGNAEFEQSVELAKSAQATLERLLGPDDPEVAASLNNLAGIYSAQGQYAQAAPLYTRALAIWEKAAGQDNPDYARCMNNLASIYSNQGQYAQAEPLFLRSLAYLERTRGPDHAEVAASLNNLAALYHKQGQYSQAEPLYKRALTIWESALGPEHPRVGASLNNLASLYNAQGQYPQAEALNKRALAIWQKALGPDHPDVARSMNDLAALYLNQGKLAEAEPLLERALAIRERALGTEHPDVAVSLNNLAALYHRQQNLAQAEPLYLRALAIWEKALGPDHPDVARTLNDLAALHDSRGQLEEARSLYLRALAIREKALGPDHPDVATSLSSLAALYHRQERDAQAEPLAARALAIRQKALAPDHPEVIASLRSLAAIERAMHRDQQAEALEARAAGLDANKR